MAHVPGVSTLVIVEKVIDHSQRVRHDSFGAHHWYVGPALTAEMFNEPSWLESASLFACLCVFAWVLSSPSHELMVHDIAALDVHRISLERHCLPAV